MKQTIEKMTAFIERGGAKSMSELARSIGVSSGALSQWKSGKYKGDCETLEAKINAYIDGKVAGAKPKESEKITVFESGDKKMGDYVINRAASEREMAIVYGAPGTGKSTILREWARSHPSAVLVEATAHTNARALLTALARALGCGVGVSLDDKVRDIAKYLRSCDRVLLIDEAEHLPLGALEDLRRVHDFGSCALVLAGTDKLMENLKGKRGELSQLYSRIGMKWTMKGLSESECEEYYGREIWEEVGVVKREDRRTKKVEYRANFRAASKLYKRAKEIAEHYGREIDSEVVETAAEMLVL